MLLPSLLALPLLFGTSAQDPPSPPDPEEKAQSEYVEITQTIMRGRPKGGDEDALKAWLADARKKLTAFATVHAKTGASYDARRDVALLVAQGEEKIDESIPLFESLLRDLAADEKMKDRRIYTLYLFANALKDDERLDAARARAQEILDLLEDDESEESIQIAAAARRTLKEIDVAANLKTGSPPLAFEAKGLDGEALSPAGFQGKVLLLDFWATWCGPCRRELPSLKTTYADLHEKGFEILGISLDNEDRDAFVDFLEKEKMTWPQVYDGKGWQAEVAQAYAVSSIPATFLVDRKGILRYRDLRGDDLRKRVEELLAEK